MLMTLIEKEIRHHILSVRFAILFLMCLLLIPLTLSINYAKYQQNTVDYQESVKQAREVSKNPPPYVQTPDTEVAKFFLKPSPLSTFATGLEEALPSSLGMTRNGIKQSPTGIVQTSLSYALGNLDFLFVVSTVFSLLALLFTFDAVAGEREMGTLRITLSNAVPRDLFLWGKLIGGYLVFAVSFLVSFLIGLLLLILQGFPFVEPKMFGSIISLTFVALLYIAVFFAIGMMISTYFDSSKTALIVAFTFWVLAVLITPRVGFLVAKLVAPTRTAQSVYMERTVLRNNLAEEREERLKKKIKQTMGGNFELTPEIYEEIAKIGEPIEKEYRQNFNERSERIDRAYQRELTRQENIGEMISRISPTSSLIYITMNLTQTGKIKRNAYFQTGNRYYDQLEEEYFIHIPDDALAQIVQLLYRLEGKDRHKAGMKKIPSPPEVAPPPLYETWARSTVDVLLLCFFAIALTTVAFLTFFRSDI